MIYEIINPSDKYTLISDDPKVAASAGIILGEGWYAVQDKDGNYALPIIALGGEKWIKETYDDYGKWFDENKLRVAECLESVMSVGINEREEYEKKMASLGTEEKEE
jgi:hypothetical protein